ncbi:hypothetical protein LX36DRAFT_652475 [Colletotrichum falcatum]|nr:hypothetical protein LX36DRAFT_652475 [Colletotrichum falcatum]
MTLPPFLFFALVLLCPLFSCANSCCLRILCPPYPVHHTNLPGGGWQRLRKPQTNENAAKWCNLDTVGSCLED